MDPEARTVLITGGSGYTGQFVTHHFASLGYKVGVEGGAYQGIVVRSVGALSTHIDCMQVVYTHYSTAAPYVAEENVEAKWVRSGSLDCSLS